MKRITTILLLFAGFCAKSQDAQFSQYYAASLYLNPGFAGIYNDPSLHMNHKRQLSQVDIINELTQISIILPIKKNASDKQSFGGAGIMAFNEKSGFRGIYERNSVFLNYAQNLNFGLLQSYLISVGVQVGYEMRKLNFSQLQWGSQYNAFYGFDDSLPVPITEFDEQQQNLIVNAGVMYYFNPSRNYLVHKYSAFFGISATNLNRPNTSFTIESESTAPMLLKYNGGIEFKMNKLFVTPSLLYLYLQGNHQFNAGLNMAYNPNAKEFEAQGTQLLFGLWYRLRDSFIFMGGVKVKALAVRVSYDLNTNLFIPDRDLNLSRNSMEISIQYSFLKKTYTRKASNPLF